MEDLKRQAGERAAEHVTDGMKVGLGTGSTVHYTLLALGRRVREEGLDIVGVPTSVRTERTSLEVGIPLGDLDQLGKLDVTIDGADEVDPHLNLIKGLGGALVREKIVAAHSRELIIVVDDTKVVDVLGTRSPLPVEVMRMGHRRLHAALADLGCAPALRLGDGDTPFVSDNGNHIYDCRFTSIPRPHDTEMSINNVIGVVENGLFLDMATSVVVASASGISVMER
ncbi:MAG: ribose-5-phosphate isomerase RpiA [Thermoplasmata archaeon]|nr:ribose-5-phosphate isomerase RpiA [Thermoplasmata archaeon]NIS11060.1 ribose-5-phosphate isomerase RpiA [Thermoplasmata archaeon]NIS18994.1 ribose-5-phosphate isomerase RpiA [Thermoplasmata archaeon]NIT76047.1 ribose-5-phosphate isomerase RpiA [Thermoplasmata archaeon]NIU48146.1 ribose-5-phosphate isomerase RpiA [Thermoplasmata archaeon]